MKGFAKTALLMGGLTALFTGVAGAMGGTSWAIGAFAFAGVMNGIAYWNSDKIVLRQYNAQEVTADTYPDLVNLVAQLAAKTGIPTPKTYIIENEQPNAFATGRNPEHGAVAVSTGLMKKLKMNEVAGVIAHELAHIKNHDTLTMTVTATMAGAIGALANMAMFITPRDGEGRRSPLAGLVVAILAPITASLVQLAISRSREFEADRVGAETSGKPEWLADALEKIAGNADQIPNHTAEAHPATAHMFIINPLHGGGVQNLFSTHPSTEERVRRLHSMSLNGQ